MKKLQMILTQILVLILVVTNIVFSQEDKKSSRYSNKGIKFSIGTNNQHMISERNLDDGEGGKISLGYGFSDNFSMWLSALGAEHLQENTEIKSEFAGLELNLQHKFKTDEAFQPYTKLGFGVYNLHQEGSAFTLVGTGVSVGLGFDYFFSRHFGIGAEVAVRKLDYIAQEVETGNGKHLTDIKPYLNGDTSAFMINLVIQ